MESNLIIYLYIILFRCFKELIYLKEFEILNIFLIFFRLVFKNCKCIILLFWVAKCFL